MIYRRLTVKTHEVFDATFKKGELMLNKEVDPNTSKEIKVEKLKEENKFNGEDLIKMMKKGDSFTKYGRGGNPHLRIVYLSEDEKSIKFKAVNCGIFSGEKSIEINDVKINKYNFRFQIF